MLPVCKYINLRIHLRGSKLGEVIILSVVSDSQPGGREEQAGSVCDLVLGKADQKCGNWGI